MFPVVLIGPTPELTRDIEEACGSLGDVDVRQAGEGYPAQYELAQIFNTLTPAAVFVEIGPSGEGLETARGLSVIRPNVPIVGFTDSRDRELVRNAKAAGVTEVLIIPFNDDAFADTTLRAVRGKRAKKLGKLFAFLPAKAGSGSSTMALGVAGALSRECKEKVLLIDADLHSGLLSLMLQLDPKRSIVDALFRAHDLDEKAWAAFPCHAQGMELLSAPRPQDVQMFSPWDYQQLLSFVRARYHVTIVDLPEVVNDATEAIVTEAQTVFVLCTPEMSSLFLARRRIFELESRGVKGKSVGVVLNRHIKKTSQLQEAERFLGRRISIDLPNSYFTAQEALRKGRPVQGRSELARCLTAFARNLAGAPPRREPMPVVSASWLSRWIRSS